jgi:hypothetical protein
MTSNPSYQERMAEIALLTGAEKLAALRALKREQPNLSNSISQSILEEGLAVQASLQNAESENPT